MAMSTKNTPEGLESLLATGEQIEHIMDMWRRRLKGRKLNLEEANLIIQNGGRYLPVMDKAADVLVDQVRSEMTNTIIHHVKVNRGRTAKEAIAVTGRKPYLDNAVVAGMPVGGPEEVDLIYFHLGRYLSVAELAAEYETRGLISDPQAQAAHNETNPAFADKHPNSTQWGFNGKVACYATFDRWDGERRVDVRRRAIGWVGDWWFAGRRKS